MEAAMGISSQPTDKKSSGTATPAILLPRWTPLSSSSSNSVNQRKRKFRYTPVVELKQKKSEANKEADVKSEAGEVNQSTACDTQNTDVFGDLNVDYVVMKDVQELTKDMLPSTEKVHKMDLFGKTHTEDKSHKGSG